MIFGALVFLDLGLFGFNANTSLLSLTLEGSALGISFYFVIYEAISGYKEGLSLYFSSVWNIFDNLLFLSYLMSLTLAYFGDE